MKLTRLTLMRDASYLLPDPGGEVVRDLLSELEALTKKNDKLLDALVNIQRILGPSAPTCEGCSTEIAEALKIIKEVL